MVLPLIFTIGFVLLRLRDATANYFMEPISATDVEKSDDKLGINGVISIIELV
jgi:hypothetical protein